MFLCVNSSHAHCRSLQRTLDELRDYQERHEHWQQQQEKLVSEQAPAELKFQQRVAFEEMRAKRDEAGFGRFEMMARTDEVGFGRFEKMRARRDESVFGRFEEVRAKR